MECDDRIFTTVLSVALGGLAGTIAMLVIIWLGEKIDPHEH